MIRTVARSRLAHAAALFGLELVGLIYAYQIVADLECSATDAPGLCSFLGAFIARGVALAACFLLVLSARPAAGRALLLRIELESGRWHWLSVHALGVALLLAPLAVEGDLSAGFDRALVAWVIGGGAAAVGAVLWLAPGAVWIGWLRASGWLPPVALAAAFLLPDLSKQVQPLWDLSGPSRATFESVYAVLRVVGAAPLVWPEARIISVAGFDVEIASACSGIEGLALVLGLSTLYALLFRTQLRAARFWLVVVPICLAASWALNVLRIATLVLIGAHLSPEFAINGFHSYAGWMLFTLLAMAMLYGAHSIAWLQRGEPAAAAPTGWRRDWNAACILPFVFLMVADVGITAAFPQPILAYPLKIVAAVAVLCGFRAEYRRFVLAPDAAAAACGGIVGLAWILSLPPTSEADSAALAAVAALGGLTSVAWAVARIAGTVVVVPLVEELFFRGYLLTRLDTGSAAMRIVAIVLSSALFGALHDRWLVAFLAGVVFALVYLRRGRLADAVAAHVVANLIVAAWAAVTKDWAAI